jgi:hypothetical protein
MLCAPPALVFCLQPLTNLRSHPARRSNMSTFDPFMNNNNGFYTANLDRYISVFDEAGVPYFASTFYEPSEGQTYTSILVRVATSPITFEIMGTSSLLNAGVGLYKHRVSRTSPGRIARARAVLDAAPRELGTNGMPVLEFLHKSFARYNRPSDGPPRVATSILTVGLSISR